MIGLVRYGFLGYSEQSIAFSLLFLVAAAAGCLRSTTGCSRRGTVCGHSHVRAVHRCRAQQRVLRLGGGGADAARAHRDRAPAGRARAEPEVVALGLDPERARAEVVKTVGSGERRDDPRSIPFTAAAKEAIDRRLGRGHATRPSADRPGHVLLAVLKQRDGVARRILVAAGAMPSDLREAREPSPPGRRPRRGRDGAAGDRRARRPGRRLARASAASRRRRAPLLAILDATAPLAALRTRRRTRTPCVKGS